MTNESWKYSFSQFWGVKMIVNYKCLLKQPLTFHLYWKHRQQRDCELIAYKQNGIPFNSISQRFNKNEHLVQTLPW